MQKNCIVFLTELHSGCRVERGEGVGGEDNRHKPGRTQTCTCAAHTHARGKDITCCVLAAHLFCPIHSHLQATATATATAEDDEPQITVCTRTSDALSPSAALLSSLARHVLSAAVCQPAACCLLWPDPGPALCAVPTGHA